MTIITTECDTALEQAYDDVLNGKSERISKPGYWTVWKNTEGFVSVRRYDRERKAGEQVTEGVIRDLYWTYLGREPEPEGLAAWVYHLDHGVDIGAIEDCFSRNDEYRRARYDKGEAK